MHISLTEKRPVQCLLTSSLQVADILEEVIRHTGPADIWQSTFSISEEFLRKLYILKGLGKVRSAEVVLDHKACRKIAGLWPFIERVYDRAYMADNHSKILLVQSVAAPYRKIAVVTSQNLTRGNRYESTVITSLPEAFDSLMSDLEDLRQLHSVPLNDIFTTGHTDN